MDDVRAVEQVLLDYFDGVDRRDPEAAVSVFAEDARAEIMTGKVLEGRDRIGRALGRVLVRYARTSHHPTNARVEIDGDRAVLRTYVYAYHRMTTGRRLAPLGAPLRRDGAPRRPLADRRPPAHRRRLGAASSRHRERVVRRPSGPPRAGADPGAGRRRPPRARRRRPGRRSRASPASARRPTRDGALPAGVKALFAAAAAAARGHARLLRDGRRAGLARPGVPAEQAWAAAAALGLARGEEVAGRLVAALLAHYGPPPAGEPHADGLRPRRRRAPTSGTTSAARSPSGWRCSPSGRRPSFEGYALLHRGVLRDGALEPKLAELLLCAVNAAELPDGVRRDPRAGGARAPERPTRSSSTRSSP